MPGYGTIRKQIAKLTGEKPELSELDHYVNDLKASVKLRPHRIRTFSVTRFEKSTCTI
jgi:hypothetical protein